MGGVAQTEGFALWDGSTWYSRGGGLNGLALTGMFGPDNRLYVGGLFTQAGDIPANNIATWNGTQWQTLGSGVDGSVQTLDFLSDGRLWIGGTAITTAGNLILPAPAAEWNGSAWTPLDFLTPPAVNTILKFLTMPDGTVYIGNSSDVVNPTIVPGATSVTNRGTGDVRPVITITAPSTTTTRLYRIENITTSDRLYFDLILNPGEIMTIDLTPGAIRIYSNVRTNLLSSVLSGSDLEAWRLQPGSNIIAVLANNSNTTATMRWRETLRSLDDASWRRPR